MESKEVKETKVFKGLNKTNKGINESRCLLAAEDIIYAQKKIVMDLEEKSRRVRSDIMVLSDLGPDNSTSLRPVHKDFDATAYVTKLQELKVEKALIDAELSIANATLSDLE